MSNEYKTVSDFVKPPLCSICGHLLYDAPRPHFHVDPETGKIVYGKPVEQKE